MNIDALWSNIQKGNEAPFTILYKKFQPGLIRYAFILLNDHSLAEEIVDDVYLKIWQNRQSIFFSESDQLRNYLYCMTRNLCMDRLKEMKTKKTTTPVYCLRKNGKNCLTKLVLMVILKKISKLKNFQRQLTGWLKKCRNNAEKYSKRK